MKKNRLDQLVAGAAIGYSEAQIAPFIRSLRTSGYEGQVLLLVSEETQQELQGKPLFKNVNLYPVPLWYAVQENLLDESKPSMDRRWTKQGELWEKIHKINKFPLPKVLTRYINGPICDRLFPPSETRYWHFLRFLKRNHYRHILISDVRDVLFQNNPFLGIPKTGICISMENPSYTISTEPHNRSWVRSVYGEEGLAAIGRLSVSCSGVTYADRSTMLKYLSLMRDGIWGIGLHAVRVALGGYDQAVHNYLLGTNKFSEVHRMHPMSSSVATLNGYFEADLKFDAGGLLVNTDGSPISVVHQYDRLSCLDSQYIERLTG